MDYNYKYEPEEFEDPLEEQTEDTVLEEKDDSIDDYETSIQELDKLERTVDPITMNPNTDAQQFPDILKNPLYVKVVPENGTLGTIVPKNTKNMQEIQDRKSVFGFIRFISMCYIGIIEDIFTMDSISISSLHNIITKEDRMIAIGITLIAIGVVYLLLK